MTRMLTAPFRDRAPAGSITPVLALLLALLVQACGGERKPDAAEGVAAWVGEHAITTARVDRAETFLGSPEAADAWLGLEDPAGKNARERALAWLVQRELLLIDADARGVTPSAEEVALHEARLDSLAASGHPAFAGPGSDELREEARREATLDRYVRTTIVEHISISDLELETWLTAHPDGYRREDGSVPGYEEVKPELNADMTGQMVEATIRDRLVKLGARFRVEPVSTGS